MMNFDNNDLDYSSELTLDQVSSPPPPYSSTLPTDDLPKEVDSCLGDISAAWANAMKLDDEGLRSAAAIDRTFRQSKALSQLGIGESIFSKMNQLEDLVSSLQTTMSSHTSVIHDVHDQISDISGSLQKIHSPNESTSTTTTATTTTPPTDIETTSTINDAPVTESNTTELRASVAKLAETSSGIVSISPTNQDWQTEEDSAYGDLEMPCAASNVAHEAHEANETIDTDDFEAAEDDGNYLRLCTMLDQLITEGHTAMESAPTTPDREGSPVQTDDPIVSASEDTSMSPVAVNEDTALPSYAAPLLVDKETTDRLRRRALEAHSQPDTDIHSIDVRTIESMNTKSTLKHLPANDVKEMKEEEEAEENENENDAIWMNTESMNHHPQPLTVDHRRPEVKNRTDRSANHNGSDAIEVSFHCQITRPGQSARRHELRRRMVLPMAAGTHPHARHMRRLPSGAATATTTTASSTTGTDVNVDAKTTTNTKSPRLGIMRRALGAMQLMHWLLFFALGVLMLDSHMCKLAGAQAVEVVESIRSGEKRKSSTLCEEESKTASLNNTDATIDARERRNSL